MVAGMSPRLLARGYRHRRRQSDDVVAAAVAEPLEGVIFAEEADDRDAALVDASGDAG